MTPCFTGAPTFPTDPSLASPYPIFPTTPGLLDLFEATVSQTPGYFEAESMVGHLGITW